MDERRDVGVVRGSRAVSRVAAVLVGAIAVLVGLAGPVAAHGGDGLIEVDQPASIGDLTVSLQVRVTYVDDGHAVEPGDLGELTVSGTGPDGASLPPGTTFTPTDVPGVYTAEVTVPAAGAWSLLITSTEPPAEASVEVDVPAPAADPEEDAPVDDGAGVGDGEGSAPDEAGAGDDEITEAITAVSAEDAGGQLVEQSDSGAPLGLLAAMALCLVVAAGGFVLWRRSQARPAGHG